MTGVQGSVGGENWCVYADLNDYCDTAAIMSYGMAWAGSARPSITGAGLKVSTIMLLQLCHHKSIYGFTWLRLELADLRLSIQPR